MANVAIIAIILCILLLACCSSFLSGVFYGRRKLRQIERERRQRVTARGRTIFVRVTRVVPRGNMAYDVFAIWHGPETSKEYRFMDIYWVSWKTWLFHRRIHAGDYIPVKVDFMQPSHYIDFDNLQWK
jgi:hypothetical protein